MGIDDKLKTAAIDAEGRLKSLAGDLTGASKLKVEVEAKQVKAVGVYAAGDPMVEAKTLAERPGAAVIDANHSVQGPLVKGHWQP